MFHRERLAGDIRDVERSAHRGGIRGIGESKHADGCGR